MSLFSVRRRRERRLARSITRFPIIPFDSLRLLARALIVLQEESGWREDGGRMEGEENDRTEATNRKDKCGI